MKRAFWLQTNNQQACEIARLAGYDMVVFDGEHGVFDVAALDRLVPFCAGIGLEPFVRVGEASRPQIQAALDMGAVGVILPQIEGLDHAARVTAFAKYPPLGSRGIGYSRTMNYDGVGPDYITAENARRLCYAMIETPGAFAAMEEIAALPCVDGLFIGPGDLSLTRGRGLFADTAADAADLKQVAETARKAGKLFAAAGPTRNYSKLAAGLGASFVTEGDELTAMMIGFKSLLS
ncbi:2,4-dihydroxyhept-2-ene-1,7-dioic acid aldolase [Nordella sp. HKS 07]|uniref:HpcH/HpaI aldolase family protein n=1 Tax=Nordella sp. HKS 07 TaxID=2712222 RepID=UPI0013E1B637|nr:aldolase/citrate lyase family protein [Nordella sp. HKS 07]QIG49795.1 2,4-dihydroxyhept-2-ene-1,7-dioic acid aldolase [Nordella sp. HKS 07]